MPKRTKSKKTVEESKLEIWTFCIGCGWVRLEQPTGMNCLYLTSDTKERMRLKFQDEILSLEVKRLLTKEEKEKEPHKNAHWVILNTAPYSSVKIGDGGLIFEEKKEKKSVDADAKGKD